MRRPRRLLRLGSGLLILVACSWAQTALVSTAVSGSTNAAQARASNIDQASRATVFLRVIGDVDITIGSALLPPAERTVRRTDVEVATGTGFVFSPLGQILTCHHVVSDGERTGTLNGNAVTIAVKVRRVEAIFPPGSGSGSSGGERYDASVVAANPDIDVAVLAISGATFPTVDLGDSDALDAGG